MFEVKSGIPIPDHTGQGVKKYPFNKLRIGDSFFVPNRTATQMGPIIHKCRPKRLWGWRFSSRTIRDEQGTLQGCHIWRIENDPDHPQMPHYPDFDVNPDDPRLK